MTNHPSAEETLRVGMVISARYDQRRLQATLQSIERLTRPPTMVVIIVPRGREHLIDLDLSLKASIPLRVLTSEGPDDAWLTGGLRQAAQEVDIAIFATEGTIFQGDYVQ